MNLQEKGRMIQLSNDGWVAGTGPDSSDGDITSVNKKPARTVPDADELEFLAGLAGLHQKIIDKINAWQSQKTPKPNAAGPTSGPKKVNTNDISSRPGSRGDLLSADKLREQLEFVKLQRQETEERSELQAQLARERQLWWNARVEAARKKLKARLNALETI